MTATCTRCLVSEKLFGVELENGRECNYCRHWDAHGRTFRDFDRLLPIFEDRIEGIRGRYEYDALVGISGGKDSTYVLQRLVKDYGLKILAVTFDNGFLTDYAKNNIRSIVEKLGVDHYFIRPDREIHKSFYRAALAGLGDPCPACAMAGYFNFTRVCHEKKIPFFIHGRSPYQMFRNFYEGSGDLFIRMVQRGIEEYSPEKLISLHTMIDGKLRELLDRLFDNDEGKERVYAEFFVDPRELSRDLVPEHLGFFVYHPYDEENMKQVIEREAKYKRPKEDGLLGHGDCMIHDASAWLFEQLHGASMVMLEVAAMVRHGSLTHAEARDMLDRNAMSESRAKPSIEHLCDSLGISREKFTRIVESLKRKGAQKYESH